MGGVVQGNVGELVKPLRGIFAWMMPFASLPIIWWWLVYDHEAGRRYWPQLAVLLFGWAVYMIVMYSPKKEQPVPPREQDVSDPGKQALQMLQRGDDCDWYSIKHSNEMHEAFDCLEIYWRTEVEHHDQNVLGHGRGPFESKAGFRVRWHVASTHTSYCEAYGLDLMTTILEARELADRLRLRATTAKRMDQKHPALDAWKANGPARKYSFHGLDVENWHVRLDYPGGLSWAEHAELEQAVAEALAKAPA